MLLFISATDLDQSASPLNMNIDADPHKTSHLGTQDDNEVQIIW